MAFIGLKLPHETTRLLAEIDIGRIGDREPRDSYHVTTHFIGDDVAIETLAAALKPIFEVTSKTRPFTVSTSHVTTFPAHPETGTVPIICLIDSPELHALRATLSRALDAAGIEYSKKFPEYRPHVTLAYSKDPLADADAAVDIHLPTPIAWGAHELVLWGGDHGDDRLIMTFPFTLGTAKAASFQDTAYRAAVRLSMSRGADDHTPPAPCPICGGQPVFDTTLGAFVCPTCGVVGGSVAGRVASRFRASTRKR